MNWITNYVRPRINSMLGRREVPENLWIKCPETGEMVFHKDLEDNKWVIPASGFHMKMPAGARLADLFDNGDYEKLPQPKVAQDPLKFRDSKKYLDRLKDSRVKVLQEILQGILIVKLFSWEKQMTQRVATVRAKVCIEAPFITCLLLLHQPCALNGSR